MWDSVKTKCSSMRIIGSNSKTWFQKEYLKLIQRLNSIIQIRNLQLSNSKMILICLSFIKITISSNPLIITSKLFSLKIIMRFHIMFKFIQKIKMVLIPIHLPLCYPLISPILNSLLSFNLFLKIQEFMKHHKPR